MSIEQLLEQNLEKAFVCPITLQIMDDPVIAQDGFTYERDAIEEWLNKNKISPFTNNSIDNKLLPNNTLKSSISTYLDCLPHMKQFQYDNPKKYAYSISRKYIVDLINKIKYEFLENGTINYYVNSIFDKNEINKILLKYHTYDFIDLLVSVTDTNNIFVLDIEILTHLLTNTKRLDSSIYFLDCLKQFKELNNYKDLEDFLVSNKFLENSYTESYYYNFVKIIKHLKVIIEHDGSSSEYVMSKNFILSISFPSVLHLFENICSSNWYTNDIFNSILKDTDISKHIFKNIDEHFIANLAKNILYSGKINILTNLLKLGLITDIIIEGISISYFALLIDNFDLFETCFKYDVLSYEQIPYLSAYDKNFNKKCMNVIHKYGTENSQIYYNFKYLLESKSPHGIYYEMIINNDIHNNIDNDEIIKNMLKDAFINVIINNKKKKVNKKYIYFMYRDELAKFCKTITSTDSKYLCTVVPYMITKSSFMTEMMINSNNKKESLIPFILYDFEYIENRTIYDFLMYYKHDNINGLLSINIRKCLHIVPLSKFNSININNLEYFNLSDDNLLTLLNGYNNKTDIIELIISKYIDNKITLNITSFIRLLISHNMFGSNIHKLFTKYGTSIEYTQELLNSLDVLFKQKYNKNTKTDYDHIFQDLIKIVKVSNDNENVCQVLKLLLKYYDSLEPIMCIDNVQLLLHNNKIEYFNSLCLNTSIEPCEKFNLIGFFYK